MSKPRHFLIKLFPILPNPAIKISLPISSKVLIDFMFFLNAPVLTSLSYASLALDKTSIIYITCSETAVAFAVAVIVKVILFFFI